MSDNVNVPAESWRGPRRSRQIDPQMVRIGVVAAGVVGIVALATGGYALIGRRPHVVPVVEADSRPIRVRPDNPGGAMVEGADEQIMGGNGTGKGKVDAMAPPSEVPAPQALRAQIQAAHPAAPAPAEAVAAAAIAKIDLPALEDPQTSAPGQRLAVPVQPTQKTEAAAPAQKVMGNLPVADALPAQKTPAALEPRAIPDRPPVAAAPTVPAPSAAVPSAAVPAAAAPAGTMQVQLGALDSEKAATAEWQRLAKRMPALLGTRQPAVLKAEHDGKTIWRLRTGGFADTASATAFCSQVRAKGVGCAIASF